MSNSAKTDAPGSGSTLAEWTLLVEPPDRQEQEVFVQHDLTIGRNPSNTIAIDHVDIERIHARVRRRSDGSVVLEAVTDQARLLSSAGESVTALPLEPDVSFQVGPATITCRRNPARQSRPCRDHCIWFS